MAKPIIRVEALGKQYRIGARGRGYKTIRETLVDAVISPFRRLNSKSRSDAGNVESLIWALKDVSFEVQTGEVLGIIGRNGAGKSTLLKILSRITEPTEGRIEIRGRVASLLEVGTGFHGELTGRENVYLNGAIMGMRKAEIDRKFDEIVAFAEVEKFVDTPVKRYSSGMYLRLAFAVAAHLEPEILLVDEVLAVGDAAFQKKCLGKMGDVAREGRTVLFVSHNMGAVSNLCGDVLWIDRGQLRRRGAAPEVIGTYLQSTSTWRGEIDLRTFPGPIPPGPACLRYVATKNVKDEITSEFEMGDTIIVEFELSSESMLNEVRLSLSVKTSTGVPVYHLVDEDCHFSIRRLLQPRRVRVTIPNVSLYPGTYVLSCWVGDAMYQDYHYAQDCLSFRITQSAFTKRNFPLSWNQGVVLQTSFWAEVR